MQVRGEIHRTNKQLAGRSSSMTFQRGGVTVRLPQEAWLLLLVFHQMLLGSSRLPAQRGEQLLS